MNFRQFRPLESREFICIGVDPAQGGNDYSTAAFLSKTHLDVPLVYQRQGSVIELTNKLVPVLEKIYDLTGVPPMIAYEANAGGIFEFERLGHLNRANKFRLYTMKTYGQIDQAVEKKLGWYTNTATRPAMLHDLKEAVDNRLLRLFDKPTINELYAFIVSKSGKPQAEEGAHDDLVMAHAIAWQLYQSEKPQGETIIRPYNKSKWVIT